MKRDRNAVVVKRWVALGNLCSTMAWNRTIHRVALAGSANASENHDGGS
jgi:hypothetical protein